MKAPAVNEQELRDTVIELKAKALQKDFIDGQIKLSSQHLDRSIAYTNVLMVAGYAGFFALWSLTRGYLSKPAALTAALLMAVSITLFVTFEIVKMISLAAVSRRRIIAILGDKVDKSIEGFVARSKAAEAVSAREEMGVAKLWPWFLSATAAFGAAGMGVLMYALLRGLAGEISGGA